MRVCDTAHRLTQLMLSRGLRQSDIMLAVQPVADKYDVKMNKSDLSQYISGKVEPRQNKIKVLAEALGVSETWLLGYDVPERSEESPDPFSHPDIKPIRRRRVPMLGDIACGQPLYSPADAELVDVDEDLDCDGAMTCRGDSMVGIRVFDGDIVYLKKQDDVEDGQVAAVEIDGELTLKRVFKIRDLDEGGNIVYRTELRAENPRYAPIRIGGPDETRHARIVGKAVAFRGSIV